MKNVFLIGNGFDLHHRLPTKYFDFICVAKYLTNTTLSEPLNVGKILLGCNGSQNIKDCYDAHKDAFDNAEIDFKQAVEIVQLLQDNIWFNYFVKTLNMDLGWIDFEQQILTVIECLDNNITSESSEISLPRRDMVAPFILNNFKYFLDIDKRYDIYEGDILDIKEEYLKEFISGSKIYVADKKKIFEKLYADLLSFSKALNMYLYYFVENVLSQISKDLYIKNNRIDLVNQANYCVSFNYTSTLEQLYFNENVYHIHGIVKNNDIVLGVNPNASDDVGTNNTSLIKFKKYYQREVRGTDKDYINWYRQTIGAEVDYRLVIIGHSLDETDKDILSDMFMNATEIYVSYYDENCRDDYIANIVKIFGKSGYDSFRKDKSMKFIALSNINILDDVLQPEEMKWSVTRDRGEQRVIV